MRIEYHPAIEGELVEIRDYYNEKSRNLGDDFINEFERQVLRIAAMPYRWMVVRGDTRRALMKRFPYLILLWSNLRKWQQPWCRVINHKNTRSPHKGCQCGQPSHPPSAFVRPPLDAKMHHCYKDWTKVHKSP